MRNLSSSELDEGRRAQNPRFSALNGEQPEGLTGRASLPPEVGVQVRYERLAVTHAITLSQLPTLSIGFIDKDQGCPSGAQV